MSNDFKKIARKIKRRRIIVSAIIILVTLMATTSVLNYKASQGNEEPFIALGTSYEFGDQTTIKITTSLPEGSYERSRAIAESNEIAEQLMEEYPELQHSLFA